MSRSLLPIPFHGRLPLAADRAIEPVGAPARGLSRANRDRAGAIVFGRLRFVDEPATKAQADPADGLLRRWLADGDSVLDAIAGEFLVALWDETRGRALAAVDRFSTYPLFWAQQGGVVAFSARPAQAASLAGLGARLDLQAMLAYAYFHMVPAPLSIFEGVRRLDLGEALVIADGRVEVKRYWNPVFDERRPFDFATERGAFLDALREGVAECTAGLPREQVGCFLSGGTDSSTIAGLVTQQYGAPARTFSIGFDVGGYDETSYSRLAAKHFGTEHTEYFLTPDDVLAGVETVATGYEQPFGNSSAVPTFFCARIARDAGIARMLGGDGGDELYGGNERYAKQAMFALYDRVPGWVRGGLLEPLLFGPLKGLDLGVLGKARSYVEQAREPLPDRLQSRYNLLNRLGARDVFTDAVLGQVSLGQPLALEREVWARARSASSPMSQINQLLAWDFKFTLADSDLPKVTRMCSAAGVDVAFPMLTRALVEHSLRLRPDEKLKGRKLRHFFKESLRGFLPDEIIAKQKHGFGMPFGDWLLTHERLRGLAEDALRSLAARGVIRDPFLKQLLAQLASGHAGYYGTMVWVLMIFELWLRASPLADLRVERD
ncbi:MAG: asparagine synthetase B [Alphaproteobacteria bacterium]|nr:MAG: asparagine synthetase B [Alphaproteobacteria bacterium]